MINKKDIIFTNLYRNFSPELISSKKRGDWINTKKILSMGKDKIVEEIKKRLIKANLKLGISESMLIIC